MTAMEGWNALELPGAILARNPDKLFFPLYTDMT